MKKQMLLLLCVCSGLGLGAAPAGRYVIGADTVLDNKSGLTWQRAVDANSYTQADAVAYCDGLTHGGFSDWRLPTVKELQTLVDVSVYNSAIDSSAFPSTPNVGFWSSSPYASGTSNAWIVNFSNGSSGYPTTTTTYRVRCVR